MAKAKKKKESNKKTLLSQESMDFLKLYHNTHSPVGFESSGQKVWLD